MKLVNICHGSKARKLATVYTFITKKKNSDFDWLFFRSGGTHLRM